MPYAADTAAATLWSWTAARSPASTSSVTSVPAGPATPTYTVPTGFPSCRSGPATPVVLTPISGLIQQVCKIAPLNLCDLIDGTLVGPIIGDKGRPYIPFVFTIFMMVLTLNMMGILFSVGNLGGQEWAFTATAQLAVTATLALLTFLSVVVIGFVKNGHRMYKLFVPSGVPIFMLPMMVIIEFISFMVRPLTLAMRLFGNMIGGHVVMYMFASFVVGLGAFALHSGLASPAYFALSGLSFFMVIALYALEFIVAFLQAFVFAALTCTYINDVVNLDHGH